ncbi:uncharacterized protein [Mobula birostris]|uniref:uncharacterized protein isoform X2 n=1 Tax=Mobula birostris TaxID=1983395 RepID=UPI003B288E95
MSSMQFLRRLSLPRLAYHRISAKNPGVMFLSGFKSNMNGEKALALEAFCDSAGYSFVRFDYTGCGSSEGNSEDCLLRDWKNDVLTVLDNLTTGPQILVGSSMGGWLMLLASLARPEKVAGMVGIATAADHLVTAFRQLPAELKKEAEVMGQYNMPSRQHLWWMFSMVGIWVPISRRAVFTTRWNALRSDTGQLQYHTEMQLFVSVLGCENIKLDCVTLTKCWRSSAGQLSTMERNAQLMFVPAEQLGIFLLLIKYSSPIKGPRLETSTVLRSIDAAWPAEFIQLFVRVACLHISVQLTLFKCNTGRHDLFQFPSLAELEEKERIPDDDLQVYCAHLGELHKDMSERFQNLRLIQI